MRAFESTKVFIRLSEHERTLFEENGIVQLRRVARKVHIEYHFPYGSSSGDLYVKNSLGNQIKVIVTSKSLERASDITRKPEDIKREGFRHISQLISHFNEVNNTFPMFGEVFWSDDPVVWVFKITIARTRTK